MFEKLEKTTYSDRIIDEIRRLIVGKELRPGDRLPAERELAEQFGVSRASIREAVRSLAALGLVEARTGDGTYVSRDLTSSVLQPLSWVLHLAPGTERDLQEARQLIEPAMAALAARRATPDDKERLRACVEAMEEALGDSVAVAEQDFAFHLVLAEAAHNSILQETIAGLQGLLRGLIAKRVAQTRESQFRCCSEHRNIYTAIEAGDAKAASEAMLRSLGMD